MGTPSDCRRASDQGANREDDASNGIAANGMQHAAHYADILDGLVIDAADAAQATDVEALGIRAHCCPTVMRTPEDRCRLADDVLAFVRRLSSRLLG